jgi:hypothetical protein
MYHRQRCRFLCCVQVVRNIKWMHLGEPWGVNYVLPVLLFFNSLSSMFSCQSFLENFSRQVFIVNVSLTTLSGLFFQTSCEA